MDSCSSIYLTTWCNIYCMQTDMNKLMVEFKQATETTLMVNSYMLCYMCNRMHNT